MDMLLRLVTCIEAPSLKAYENKNWLCENKLVERLISHINPEHDEELHTNAAQSLCDIIRLSREHMFTCQESAQEDPIMKVLEKQETIELLLKNMCSLDSLMMSQRDCAALVCSSSSCSGLMCEISLSTNLFSHNQFLFSYALREGASMQVTSRRSMSITAEV